MNAMLLLVKDSKKDHECSVYMQQPYSPEGAQALNVASWTPHRGLTLTSSLPLFPDKFSRLSNKPQLVVVSESYPTHEAVMVDDPKVPGRKVLWFFSPFANVLQLLADTTNFTYTYVRPPDGLWGSPKTDGSWSGMVGMVSREEVDIGLGPFTIGILSAKEMDFTWPVTIESETLLGGRGRLEVNPWGFLFPLEPLVWATILVALLVLSLTVFLMSSCTSIKTLAGWMDDIFKFLSLILNQGITERDVWWWERVVMAVWGLVTVVLTQSYAGNLMALLAVRHIPQPIQSLQDVLDHHSVTLLVQSGSAKAVYFTTAEAGILRNVANLQKVNRLKFIKTSEFLRSINTLVRNGHHILSAAESLERAVMAQDFSRTGLLFSPLSILHAI
nr:probable glutamate receptor [Procambarus clarkii]